MAELKLSRRQLLLGSAALSAATLLHHDLSQNVAVAQEFKPLKKKIKHCFAFDTGIYHGNKMQNMRLTMGKVQKAPQNPLFIDGIYETPSKAWEPRIDNGYPNVILGDDGIYRCYYTLFVIDPSSTEVKRTERHTKAYQTKGRRTGLAYAESKDGITWHKPNLGLVEFNGSKENNLLMLDVAGTGVLFEANEPDPNKRYKLITRKETGSKPLAVAFSSDGVHFSALQEWAENSPKLGADCHNSVFKDSRTNQYILTTRLWANNFRVVALSRSDDFIHWSPLEEVLRGNGFEEQIYSMPVFEYNDLYFGLASVYQQGDNTQPNFDTLDLQLYWSSNLTEWNKIVPQENIFVPNGAGREKFTDGEFDSATIFAAPMYAGDNRLYYMGGKGRHRSWRESGLGLAYVDKDRLAGMTPRNQQQAMKFTTQSFKFNGEQLFIWLDLEKTSDIQIEIEGVSGFSADNCQLEKITDHQYRVQWLGQSLQEASKEKRLALTITAKNATFWGISGEFEMDESRYWKG